MPRLRRETRLEEGEVVRDGGQDVLARSVVAEPALPSCFDFVSGNRLIAQDQPHEVGGLRVVLITGAPDSIRDSGSHLLRM